MESRSMGFVGGGRVARILLSGWVRSGQWDGMATLFDQNKAVVDDLKRSFPGRVAEGSLAEAAGCDVVFLALHPPVLAETVAGLRPFLKPGSLVVSLAPKVTLAALKDLLGGAHPLARVNPSAPGVVGSGLNPINFGEGTGAPDREYLLELFGWLGAVPEVAEEKLEAYALISAMGPTYFWFQWEVLQELGVEFGLDPEESRSTVELMVQGALKTLFHSNLSPAQVMDLVPVRPLGDKEATVRSFYKDQLGALFQKIQPARAMTRSPL